MKLLLLLILVSFSLFAQSKSIVNRTLTESTANATSENLLEIDLKDAEALAAKNNISVKMQKFDLAIAANEKKIAKAMDYPDVNAVTGYTYLNPPPRGVINLIPDVVVLRPKFGYANNYSAGLQMRYLLYSGGKVSTINEIATLGEEASRWLLRDSLKNAIYEARRAYFLVLLQKEMFELAKNSEKRASARYSDGQKKLHAGTITRLEFMRLETEASDSSTIASEVGDRYRFSLDQLKILLDIPAVREVNLKDNLKDFVGMTENKKEELAKNPPVFAKAEIARIQAQRAEKKIQVAKADYLPSISAGVMANYVNPYQMMPTWGNMLSVNVSATLPVLDWGKRKYNLENANYESQKSQAIVANIRRQMEGYYKNLIDKYESAKKGIISRQINLERALQTRDSVETAKNSGAATYSDLSDSDLFVFRIEVEYLQNISDLLIILSDLERFTNEQYISVFEKKHNMMEKINE